MTEIRLYRPEDERGWLECRVLAFLNTAYFDNVYKEKEVYENPSLELVAEEDGKIIGLLDIECETKPGQFCANQDQRSGMIWHMAVHPNHGRKGIATLLLRYAEKILTEKGIRRLEAWTRDDQWVQNWYRKNGFQAADSYLHVYMEGNEMNGMIESKSSKLFPVTTFAHYTGEEREEMKKRFKRVHECFMFEKRLTT